MSYNDQDPTNVKVVGGKAEERRKPTYLSDWPKVATGLSTEEAGEAFGEAARQTPRADDSTPSSPLSGRDRRQAILDEAAQLAYQALKTFQQAVDTAGITDIKVAEKYAGSLRGLAEAAESFEKKL